MHPTLAVESATVRRQGRAILDDVSLRIAPGEHWALLGPNGAGKSTLLALCGAREHPTSGTVHVLGKRLGRVDMRELRTHLGHVDPRTRIDERTTVREVILTGLTASSSLLPNREIDDADRSRAHDLATELGVTGLLDSAWQHLSQGERGRVLIARALMAEPSLLLLDEPATGLDLTAREILLTALRRLAATRPDMSTLYVTHHLEELPTSTSHAALLREGRLVTSGPAQSTLTGAALSEIFGLDLDVHRTGGRWSATAVEG